METEDKKLAAESLEPSVDLNEAPASVNIVCWAEGFRTQFTVRDNKVKEVVIRLEYLLEFIKKKGWKPDWRKEEEPIEKAVEQVRELMPRTKVCDCGQTRTYKTGVKNGRKWGAFFCPNPECKPEWVGVKA